jgi:hypothetical protein
VCVVVARSGWLHRTCVLPAVESVRRRSVSRWTVFVWRGLSPEPLYEQFWPEIPSGVRGWGATGDLDLGLIESMAKKS